jgi:hypothetical protein
MSVTRFAALHVTQAYLAPEYLARTGKEAARAMDVYARTLFAELLQGAEVGVAEALLSRIVAKEPEQRPSVQEVVAAPLLRRQAGRGARLRRLLRQAPPKRWARLHRRAFSLQRLPGRGPASLPGAQLGPRPARGPLRQRGLRT